MDMDKTAIGVTIDPPGEANADQKTQMMSAPASNATQMAMNVECPVCRTANPPSETYCIDCGFLLSGAPVSVAEMPEATSMGKLITTDGTREFPLNAGRNTVGRENADVLLAHNTVSRKHATVTVEDGKAFAEDSGSTNGTYVDGKKLAPDEKAELKDGCDVVFGSFSLKYEAPAALAESVPEVAEQSETAAEPSTPSEFDLATPLEAAEPGSSTEEVLEEAVEVPEAPVAAPVGKLVAKDGSCTFDLHEGKSTIGRREGDNDIVIPDPYCSGRHADLTFDGRKFTITDIGSTNGTFVNGVKLDANAPHELATEDEITLGRAVFVILNSIQDQMPDQVRHDQ